MPDYFERLRNALRRDTAAAIGAIAQPRHALVQSVDPNTHSVRLLIQPEGLLTGWVPDASAFATGGGYGVVSPLSPGDQVVVVHAHGDADEPVIVGRLFSTVDMPPVSPATGKPVGPGEFAAFTAGAWLHIQGGEIHAQASRFVLKGDMELDGKLTTTGDVVAGTVSLQQHRNTGVRVGSDLSGPPEP